MCCSVMKFYFTTTTDSLPELQDIPQSLSRLELQYEMQQRSAWPGAHNLSPAEGSSEGFSVAASFTLSSQPSATLIKVDFSLNLFFLSLRCFITDIFSSNIFVPFFICRPAQVLYSRSACQKISPKLDCIKSRSLYCSVLAKIISDQQKPEREKLKSPKIETHFLRSSAQ